jgi:ribonuclease-3
MKKLMKKLGYTFKDEDLLRTALTHSSYANENKKKAKSYERLEFLGDSVLSFVISTYIYNHFKNLPEGAFQKCGPLWYAKGALRAARKSFRSELPAA